MIMVNDLMTAANGKSSDLSCVFTGLYSSQPACLPLNRHVYWIAEADRDVTQSHNQTLNEVFASICESICFRNFRKRSIREKKIVYSYKTIAVFLVTLLIFARYSSFINTQKLIVYEMQRFSTHKSDVRENRRALKGNQGRYSSGLYLILLY